MVDTTHASTHLACMHGLLYDLSHLRHCSESEQAAIKMVCLCNKITAMYMKYGNIHCMLLLHEMMS